VASPNPSPNPNPNLTPNQVAETILHVAAKQYNSGSHAALQQVRG